MSTPARRRISLTYARMPVLANLLIFSDRCSDGRKNCGSAFRSFDPPFLRIGQFPPLPRDVGANLCVLANLQIFRGRQTDAQAGSVAALSTTWLRILRAGRSARCACLYSLTCCFSVGCSDGRKNLCGSAWRSLGQPFLRIGQLSPLPRDVGANLFVLANLRNSLRPATQCATEQREVAMLEMRASQVKIKAHSKQSGAGLSCGAFPSAWRMRSEGSREISG